jgi:hypothetical protein
MKMSDAPLTNDTRGIAITVFSLAFAIIVKLGAKGLLSKDEINDLLRPL